MSKTATPNDPGAKIERYALGVIVKNKSDPSCWDAWLDLDACPDKRGNDPQPGDIEFEGHRYRCVASAPWFFAKAGVS